jgi:rSAM/selenodomain-associated transferase 2
MSHRGLVTIVIPALDEERAIGATLDAVARVRGAVETIVVDGGSRDRTVEIARSRGARVLTSARGRGAQMRAGAAEARGKAVWFVHADTRPPEDGAERLLDALETAVGGNFEIVFDGPTREARGLTRLYPWLRLLGLCYGDSAIFARRDVYERIGGMRPYPIFEDIDLVRRLKREGRYVRLSSEVVTSSRRFEGRSFTLTFARWAAMQVLYWLGVSPYTLARWYAPIRSRRSDSRG